MLYCKLLGAWHYLTTNREGNLRKAILIRLPKHPLFFLRIRTKKLTFIQTDVILLKEVERELNPRLIEAESQKWLRLCGCIKKREALQPLFFFV